jgi:hypothetical protein
MYLQLAIILGCLLLFIASGIVGNQILKKSQTKNSETKNSETKNSETVLEKVES